MALLSCVAVIKPIDHPLNCLLTISEKSKIAGSLCRGSFNIRWYKRFTAVLSPSNCCKKIPFDKHKAPVMPAAWLLRAELCKISLTSPGPRMVAERLAYVNWMSINMAMLCAGNHSHARKTSNFSIRRSCNDFDAVKWRACDDPSGSHARGYFPQVNLEKVVWNSMFR